MNLDLAIMALDGLVRAPVDVRVDERGITISGPSAGLKDLARLLLLIASDSEGETVELQPGVHTTAESMPVKLEAVSSKL
jgi:hypothetical protein